jgi:hypothetical protein
MKLSLASATAVATVAIASTVHADFTDVTFTGNAAFHTVTIVSPGYSGELQAGQLTLNLANSTGSSGYLDGNWIAFCADIFQPVGPDQYTYEIVPVSTLPTTAPMGVVVEQGVSELYAYAAGAQYANDNDIACAFQLAMWEVINDFGNLNLNTGNFQASGLTAGTIAYANLLLASVGSGQSANIIGLRNFEYQDMILEVPGPGALALLGAAGLFGRRRRS